MNEPTIIGKDLDLGPPPRVKVVLLLDKTDELEKELSYGWKIAMHYPHAQGAIFLLLKS